MKKLFLIAAVAAALASCSKSDNPQVKDQKEGIKMTLSADFGTGTKLTFAPSGNTIKSTWDASETISVLTLNESDANKVVAIDNFTSTGAEGRTTATFTGTFTGGSDATKVIVIYPALTSGESAKYTNMSGSSVSVIAGVEVGKATYSGTFNFLKQTADNNCAHLKNYCIASGYVDLTKIKSNELSVSLKFYIPVMKIVATFPDAYKGKDLTEVSVRCVNSSDEEQKVFSTLSWNYIDIPTKHITCPGGGDRSDVRLATSFKVPDSGVATLYIPFVRLGDFGKFYAGTGFKIEAKADGTTLSYKKLFTSDKYINYGAVYTIDATLAE